MFHSRKWCLKPDHFVNVERLFGRSVIPIKNTAGEMDKHQIREWRCVSSSKEWAHDSDMTDEISQRADLAVRDAILCPGGQRTGFHFCDSVVDNARAGTVGNFWLDLEHLQYS